MKKILSVFLMLILFAGAMLSLTSCGEEKLSGTYEYKVTELGIVTELLTFNDNNVEYTLDRFATLGIESLKGTYSIKDDKITMTFTAPDATVDYLQSTYDNAIAEFNEEMKNLDFAKDGNTITIAGKTFTKKQ